MQQEAEEQYFDNGNEENVLGRVWGDLLYSVIPSSRGGRGGGVRP